MERNSSPPAAGVGQQIEKKRILRSKMNCNGETASHLSADPPAPTSLMEDMEQAAPSSRGLDPPEMRKKSLDEKHPSSILKRKFEDNGSHPEEEASKRSADPPAPRLSSATEDSDHFSTLPVAAVVTQATLVTEDNRIINASNCPDDAVRRSDSSSVHSQQLPWWKQKRFVWMGIILVALVVLVVVLVLFLGGSGDGQDEDQSADEQPNDTISSQTTRPPSPPPTIRRDPTIACFWVVVNIVFDDYPGETSWDIQRVGGSDAGIVKTYQAEAGSDSHTESYCLEEGQYMFTIYDKGGDGICCGPGREGSYNVVLNGEVIAQGDEFGESETTLFDITDQTCHQVDLNIAFDDYPGETSWDIQRVSSTSSGDGIVVNTYDAADGESSYTESFCLEDGQYRFTIYDEGGDGICCGPGREGFYNLTSEGQVIAQGDEFGSTEATVFKIPRVCFQDRDELKAVVDEYIEQDCTNNSECAAGQAYGWPIGTWCVSQVTDMSYLFYGKDTFNEELSGWDVSQVTNMQWMFFRANSFTGDLSSWDTSSVQDMSSMFRGATNFNGELCAWGNNFPYDSANNIFLNSGCTLTNTPKEGEQGPFCASECNL